MMDPGRAASALDEVERRHGVRVLLAVESGSRAWGFPSADSDYDVRFLYVRPLSAYLSVEAPRDVIEQPMDGMLDLGGWDMRKALGLMVRSNAVVLEWLASPVVYRRDPDAAAALADLAHGSAHLSAWHTTMTAWPGALGRPGTIRCGSSPISTPCGPCWHCPGCAGTGRRHP